MIAECVRACVLVVMLGTPAQAQGRGPSPQCESLLACMEAYHDSIESIKWRQVEYLPPAQADQRETWRILQESHRYFDRDAWAYHDSIFWTSGPPDFTIEHRHGIYMAYGGWRATYVYLQDPRIKNRGMLTAQDHFSAGGCNVPRLLGLYLETMRPMYSRDPITLLRGAERWEYLEPTDIDPWPGVMAYGAINDRWLDLEVRVDPERGFVPRVIRTHRASDGWLVEELRVLDCELVDGAWIPSLGMQIPNYTTIDADLEQPYDAIRLKDFADALKLEGLPERIRTDKIRRCVERSHKPVVIDRGSRMMSGLMGTFRSGEPTICPQIMIANSFRLNTRMTLDDMMENLLRDAPMYDGATGEKDVFPADIRARWEQILKP